MNNQVKFQKKVLKLINAIKKCDINDLELFVALCLIRFDLIDAKNGKLHARFEDSSIFGVTCDLARELNADDNIHYLLN